jgi:uncharacterized membrane protein YraQ (UPF0718 family)
MLFNISLYSLTVILLGISFLKDKGKTKKALFKGWKSFENILPQFLSILIFVGILLAFLNPSVISKILGVKSGWWGVFIASIVGAITLIPGYIAFPTAALLIKGGAGYMQMGAFISSLMMVGVVTMPIEIKFFNKKSTLLRNGLSFIFSFLVAFIISRVMGQ